MSETDASYRKAPTGARYVCVACFQCSSLTEQACANCGNKMQSIADPEVSKFVIEEASRRVNVIAKKQMIFAGVFAVPLMVYLVFLTAVGKTLSFLGPTLLWLALVAVHPYIFRADSRVGRKYRRNPTGLSEAFDILGTRSQ